jgi:hypothetical protein
MINTPAWVADTSITFDQKKDITVVLTFYFKTMHVYCSKNAILPQKTVFSISRGV